MDLFDTNISQTPKADKDSIIDSLKKFFSENKGDNAIKKQQSENISKSTENNETNKTNISKETQLNLKELKKEFTIKELKTISAIKLLEEIKLEDRLQYLTKKGVKYSDIAN
jgi:hypothetical protein